jgi:N-acetylmuramoyl-L-alanine amidase
MGTLSAKDTTAIKLDTDLIATPWASPNHGERKRGRTPDSLILHYTGVPTGEAAIELLCDPVMQVSAHYVVMPDGALLQLVPEGRRAWHAGRGVWDDETDMNDVSIGIEIAHQGHKDGGPAYPYPAEQIATVIALSHDIIARWKIAPHRILAHSDIAPDRKIDPGEFFPWAQLAKAGVGHYVAPCPIADGPRLGPDARGGDVEELQTMLARYGYGVEINALYDARTQAVVRAFQRHFRPALVDGVADASTVATLRKLLAARGAA